jgi:hypothetical protein
MGTRLDARLDAGNWQPTAMELELDAYEEEIEPQVWQALVVLHEKGYESFSSGFYGTNCKYQRLTGILLLVPKQRGSLLKLG